MSLFGLRLDNVSLVGRVWAIILANLLVLILIMLTSGWGLYQSRASLVQLHDERMVAAEHISSLVQDLYDSRLNILLGFQHDPSSPLFKLHGHELSLHTDIIAKNNQNWTGHLQSLRQRSMDTQEVALLRAIEERQQAWQQKANEAVSRLQASDFSPDSMQEFLLAGRNQADGLFASLDELQKYQSKMADIAAKDAEERYQQNLIIFALILIFVGLPGILLTLASMRRLRSGIRSAEQAAEAIARGDLTWNGQDKAGDEIGRLITQMRTMRDNLSTLISRIMQGSNAISSASDQVAHGTQELSDRTEQQAAALEETSAATEELNSTVLQNADNAAEVDKKAQSTAQLASRGGQVTSTAVSTMEEIRQASEKIGEIVNIIDGIAFQTNILALNAAVEAARAGEAGRGFAVVAGEVRALAQRSAGAAREIKEVIQKSVDGIRQGSNQVGEAGVAMGQIVEHFEDMKTLIGEIASASKEQALGLSQINEAVNHMDATTQSNAHLVENTMKTAAGLQQQAAEFRALVATFKLDESQLHYESTDAPYLHPAPQLR